MSRRTKPSRRFAAVLVSISLVTGSLLAAGIASGAGKQVDPSVVPSVRGSVNVFYAGSLVRLMDSGIGPLFTRLTGYRFVGFSGGSKELASEIKGGVERGDVFVSASPSVDKSLEGRKNGAWVSWFVTFGRSELVLGYNKKSRFAKDLRSRPWYKVITLPGFRLGRTDPTIDPKGALTVEALRDEARRTGDRALLSIANSQTGVYPEETLLGRLQAGQLDGGFFYLVEAKAAGLPTESLAPILLAATFAVTTLAHSPDEAGAVAFVRFLLGKQAGAVLMRDGITVRTPPLLSGSNVPSSITALTKRS